MPADFSRFIGFIYEQSVGNYGEFRRIGNGKGKSHFLVYVVKTRKPVTRVFALSLRPHLRFVARLHKVKRLFRLSSVLYGELVVSSLVRVCPSNAFAVVGKSR